MQVSEIALLDFDEWVNRGAELVGGFKRLHWEIGDWLREGKLRYGQKAAIKSRELFGVEYNTVRVYGMVADAFSENDRRRSISFSLHREVLPLAAEERQQVLDRAADEGLSVREVRAEVARRTNAKAVAAPIASIETCTTADLEQLVQDGKRFGTIYADPPWLYDNQGTRAATGNHYGGMTVDELCALPVRELADDDAHLHLWITNGFLFDAPRIFDAWGFEFRSTFVWVKPQMGIGNYWRNSHEFLLTAVRGGAKRFNDHSMMSWGQFDRTQHSAKPEQIRDLIQRASGGPYLELFGRRRVTGWTIWGNQIERNLFHAEAA